MQGQLSSNASSIPLGYHFLIFSYNVATLATYWVSIDHFPEHMGWLDSSITNSELSSKYPLLISFLVLEILFFISNQGTMPYRLTLLFKKDTQTSKELPILVRVASMVSASWKSIISTTSYLTLVHDVTRKTFSSHSKMPLVLSGSIASFFFFPNLIAQYSNFLELFIQESNGSHRCDPKWLSSYATFGYVLCDTALYFNTFDKSFTRWFKNNGHLTDLSNTAEKILLGIGSAWSMPFAIETAKIFYFRILKVLSPTNLPRSSAISLDSSHKLSKMGYFAAMWKCLVTSLSLLTILDAVEPTYLSPTFVIVCLLGNLVCQLSLYVGKEINCSRHSAEQNEQDNANLPNSYQRLT